MDGKSSADLWHDYEGGDPEALNRLVERVYERLLAEVQNRLVKPRYARLRSRLDAGDVCNDILARAMASGKLAAFFENKNATFLSWLIGFIDGELHNLATKRSVVFEVRLEEAEDEEHEHRSLQAEIRAPLRRACAARWWSGCERRSRV